MAKLSARGRTCVAAVIRKWKNPNEPRYLASGDTVSVNVELEWTIRKKRLMSDGHILEWEKWKHFRHDKPFITNWRDLGCFKHFDPSGWLQVKLNQGWTEDKSV